MPRFMKRNKVPDYKDKNVFGVPFTVMIQRTGQALPQCVLHAMRFLRKTSRDALGIFRKSGVRSRIQKLRNEIEANPGEIDKLCHPHMSEGEFFLSYSFKSLFRYFDSVIEFA